MAPLVVMSCVLLIFSIAQTGALLRVRIDEAPTWLGVIVPAGILLAIRRIPSPERLPWVLIACGFIIATSARQFGLATLSAVGSFGLGAAALALTVGRRARIVATPHRTATMVIWLVLTILVVAAILLFPLM